MRESEVNITPSVLDRLLDFEPKISTEVPKSRSKTLRELKQFIRRDLEWLLNTRHSADKIPEKLEEVNKSLAVYGLPDFTTLSSRNDDDRKKLTQGVENALRIFEPRLIHCRVSLERVDEVVRGIKFRIEASMWVEPSPEPIVFDTILQVGNGQFEVKEK
jgi:type VI secretion system protein ImpF